MMKEAFESEIKAIAEKYGYDVKFELTEKIMSLKLEDIVKKQVGKTAYFPTQFGLIFSDSVSVSSYYVEQIKESSARKSLLFGMIQRIADYANVDWVADWDNVEQAKYVPIKNELGIRVELYTGINFGMPPIKSLELYKQAIEQNKDIFEQFFKL